MGRGWVCRTNDECWWGRDDDGHDGYDGYGYGYDDDDDDDDDDDVQDKNYDEEEHI